MLIGILQNYHNYKVIDLLPTYQPSIGVHVASIMHVMFHEIHIFCSFLYMYRNFSCHTMHRRSSTTPYSLATRATSLAVTIELLSATSAILMWMGNIIASYPGSLFFESLVHTDYACVHFSQHSWEIVIFQYIPRFTDPAHVIENEAVS